MPPFLKKTALLLFAVFVLCWLMRNWLFAHLFSYRTDSVVSAQLVDKQPVAPPKLPPAEASSILRDALGETCGALRFSFKKCPSDPAGVAKTGRANCIGYAAFFKDILEKKLATTGYAGDFQIGHRRGRLHFLGLDIHRFSRDKFWEDHDFVAVRQVSSGAEWVVDAGLFDVFGVGFEKK